MATGAIAIGTTATSTSTTKIISTRTTTRTSTVVNVVKLARATDGNITRNTAEMRRMVTEEPRTSSVVKVLVVRAELAVVVALGELVVRAGLVELVNQVALAELVNQAGLVGLVNLAASAELAVRAALVVQEVPLELNPEAELELNPEAELELNPGAELAHVRVAVQPPRTKSVTVAHHRGLVPALKVEDLAVAAQSTPEQAAAEAVRAWAAAG